MEIKPKFKTGEYVYVGNIEDKRKCIYLCTFLEKFYICVSEGFDEDYLNNSGCQVPTSTWTKIHSIEPEFTYPMWFKSATSDLIVRFDSLNAGEAVVATAITAGFICDYWPAHTNTDEWVQVPEPEFTYPMWFKTINSKKVVKFSNLCFGQEIIDFDGKYIGDETILHNDWLPHTDTDNWVQIPEPKPMRMVYEYIHQDEFGFFETICIPEDEITTYVDTYCKPTGR